MRILFRYRTVSLFIAIGICIIVYNWISNLKAIYDGTVTGLPYSRQKVNHTFIEKEIEFLNVLEKGDVPAFLIEPRMLIYLLNKGDLNVLRKKKIPIAELLQEKRLTTYGIFETNSIILNENLIERMKLIGYKYEKTESLDARYFHWNDKKNKSIKITGHHFFVKLNHVHHLVVLYKRNTFLWSPGVVSLPPLTGHILRFEDITFGRHASGFEKFEIRTVNFGNHVVNVPSDIKQFLFEIPSSKFVECNYEVARQFYAKYWKEGKPSESFDEHAINAIKAVKELVKPFLIPFWICSGTLLGWYRQCDIIPYTTDVDLAAWSTDISESFEQAAKQSSSHLRLKSVFGVPWESYQYAFSYSGLKVDFFFTYKEESIYYYGGHIVGRRLYFHYNYPKFTLCSGELVGNKILVPCNSAQVVSAEYGKNWTVPVKSWSYHSSAYNIGPKIKWPSYIAKKTYREY